MEPLTNAILRQVQSLGFAIQTRHDGQAVIFAAVERETGQTFTVRADDGDGYRAACELAELVGIDLADG